jgi:hypothetical protein
MTVPALLLRLPLLALQGDLHGGGWHATAPDLMPPGDA